MRTINGNLSLMSLMDIIQWADSSMRTGTLILTHQGQLKKFYLQDGRIIFIWSDCRGERLVDFLRLESAISQQKLQETIAVSEYLGLPFIGYLLSQNIINRMELEDIVKLVAEAALTDALKWETGNFEFIDELPSFVLNGPIKLDATKLLFESVKKFDETNLEKSVDVDQIAEEIKKHIQDGNIELPTIPDIIQRIMERIDDPNVPIESVLECITDQILVSKILRICNSPYYRNAAKVSTLKEAVILIGLKSLLSIVTVHALSSFSPRNAQEIRKVLQHCLVSALIARQLARDIGTNSELAFMSSLLHDIGKTIMLDMISDYMISADIRLKLIDDHHSEIGFLLARKWNFGEEIQECIRYHHNPEKASRYQNLVEVVYLSNIMAQSAGSTDGLHDLALNTVNMDSLNITDMIEQVDNLDQSANEMIG